MNKAEALRILGLQSNYTDSDLKSAYRQGVKRWHPDMGGNTYNFQMVQLAYELLRKSGGNKLGLTQSDLFCVSVK